MKLNDNTETDQRLYAIPDIHGHAKGEHKPFAEERPIPYTARMLFLWFFHACRRNSPRFVMVADHMNYLTFEDPAAVNLVRRALKLAQAGDLYGAAETAGVELGHAAVVSEGLRRGMRYSIGAEIDNDPRCRPDAQNIVDAMKPDGMIRSVHFLPITHPTHGENWMWPFDNPEFKDLYDVVGLDNVWEIYMTTLLDAIDKLPGHIVGHFYVPAKFGHWPADDVLEAYEDRFLAACAERNMAIEVNSRYFYKYFLDDEAQRSKYRAVHLRLLRKAKERGVMVAVGSDAHSPKDQGSAFDIVLALLDEAEINEIAFPLGGRLARVALRATAEILREHSKALAAPAERVAARAAAAMNAPIVDDDADSDDDDDAIGGEAASKTEISEAPTTIAEPIEASAAVAVSANATATSAPAKKRPPKKVVTVVEAVLPSVESAPIASGEATIPSPPDPKPSDPVAIAKPDVAPATKSKAIAKPATAIAAPTAAPEPIEAPAKPAAPKPVATKAVATKAVAPKAVAVKPVAAKQPVAIKSTAAKPVAAKPVAAKPAATKIAPVKSKTAKTAPVKAAEAKSAPKSAAPKARAKPKSAVAKATAKPARPVAKTVAKPSKAAPAKSVAKKPARSVTPAKKTSPKPVAKKASAKPARAAAKRAPVAKKAAKPISRAAKAKAPVKKVAAKKPAAKKSARGRR